MRIAVVQWLSLALIVLAGSACGSNASLPPPTAGAVAIENTVISSPSATTKVSPQPQATARATRTPSSLPSDTPTPAPTPTPPDPCHEPETARLDTLVIAFTANRGGTEVVYTVHGDGSHLTRLTKQGFAPAWAPDGKHIAFLVKTDRSKLVEFTNPDGTTETVTVYLNELHLVAPDGTDDRTLSLAVSPMVAWKAVEWSPDSSRLVFYGETSDHNSAYVLNLSDNTLTDLTPPQASVDGGIGFTWSPDGQAIAFQAPLDELHALYYRLRIVNPDGTGLRVIDSEARDDWMPSWHPNSQQILFVSSEIGESPQLFTINFDGSERRQLTHTITDGKSSPRYSPDGRKIVYKAEDLEVNSKGNVIRTDQWLYLMDSNGTNQSTIVEGKARYSSLANPEWAPNSRYLAFAWAKSGQWDLYVADICVPVVRVIAQNISSYYVPSWRP